MEKIDLESDKKILLLFEKQKEFSSWREMSKILDLDIRTIKKRIKKLEEKGVIEWDYFNVRLKKFNRNKIKIKRFSWKVFKEMLLIPSITMFCVAPLAFINYFIFFGALIVYLPHFVYSFFKILKEEENYEIFVTKENLHKKINKQKSSKKL